MPRIARIHKRYACRSPKGEWVHLLTLSATEAEHSTLQRILDEFGSVPFRSVPVRRNAALDPVNADA